MPRWRPVWSAVGSRPLLVSHGIALAVWSVLLGTTRPGERRGVTFAQLPLFPARYEPQWLASAVVENRRGRFASGRPALMSTALTANRL
ncbi:hypothetical protein KCP73_08340 [Salmonella enterica subsp. enterica]|nr:hypothetical protein KCP73_08340 [Salmonella enterica subsp. enterica]